MKAIVVFLLCLLFTFVFIFQIRHFIKDEGESIYQAMLNKETLISGILSVGFWIWFIVYAINS